MNDYILDKNQDEELNNPKTILSLKINAEYLNQVELIHFYSALYEEPLSQRTLGCTETKLYGYTEWVSNTVPAISISWDWQLIWEGQTSHYIKQGSIFSNIVLQHEGQLFTTNTDVCQLIIEKKIMSIEWQKAIQGFLQ